MRIEVFSDYMYFRPAWTKRGTPVERVAWQSLARDLRIPGVRDTIAKYKKDPKYKPTGYDADHAWDMDFTARMIPGEHVPPMMLETIDLLSGGKGKEIWNS